MNSYVLDGASKSTIFREGLRDSIAFAVAFVLLYLSLGMLGAVQSLSLAEMLANTIFIFSTPLQFLLVQNAASGWLLAPLIIVMNARFSLMSAAISPHIKCARPLNLVVSSVLIVPSVFTACMARFKHNKEHRFHYFLGVGIPLYVVSILCTYVGYVAGTSFDSPIIAAIAVIILPLQVTALVAKHWPHYYEVSSYWAGFLLAPLLVYIFKQYNLLLTPFLIAAAMVTVENMLKKGDEE